MVAPHPLQSNTYMRNVSVIFDRTGNYIECEFDDDDEEDDAPLDAALQALPPPNLEDIDEAHFDSDEATSIESEEESEEEDDENVLA